MDHERVDGEFAEAGDLGGRRHHVDVGGGLVGVHRNSLVSKKKADSGRSGTRLGGVLQLLECVLHAVAQLPYSVGRDIDDARPGRDPSDLIGLGHLGAALDGLEAVPPHDAFLATLLGRKGELAARIGGEHAAAPRPLDQATGARAVVADEPGAFGRPGRTVDPLHLLAFRAPLPHAGHVGHHAVEALRRGLDHDRAAVVAEPPPGASLRIRVLGHAIYRLVDQGHLSYLLAAGVVKLIPLAIAVKASLSYTY